MRRLGPLYLQDRGQDLQYGVELASVQFAIVLYMAFIAPGLAAGRLHIQGHGAAVIGAIA